MRWGDTHWPGTEPDTWWAQIQRWWRHLRGDAPPYQTVPTVDELLGLDGPDTVPTAPGDLPDDVHTG